MSAINYAKYNHLNWFLLNVSVKIMNYLIVVFRKLTIKNLCLNNCAVSGKKVYGLQCITLTNLSIFSWFLARIILILHFTKNV